MGESKRRKLLDLFYGDGGKHQLKEKLSLLLANNNFNELLTKKDLNILNKHGNYYIIKEELKNPVNYDALISLSKNKNND